MKGINRNKDSRSGVKDSRSRISILIGKLKSIFSKRKVLIFWELGRRNEDGVIIILSIQNGI